MPSINQTCNNVLPAQSGIELQKVLEAFRLDLAALTTAYAVALAKIDVLTAKLNADAGVTDTNYATNFVSTCTPAAASVTA